MNNEYDNQDDLERAGLYKCTSSYISAEYIGNGVVDAEEVMEACVQYTDIGEMDKLITGIIERMFLNEAEFIINFSNSTQVFNIHVSWDWIIYFLDKYREAKKDGRFFFRGIVTERIE